MLVLALLGCESNQGVLVVQVRTDLAPGTELTAVRVELGERRAAFLASDSDAWARGVRVAELTLPRGEHRLLVSALGPGEALVTERGVRVEVEDVSVATVYLTRDCAGVDCTGEAERTACFAGRCVEEGCSEETPEACGDAACSSAAECVAPGACATAECTAGGCFFAPDHAACAAGEICDPAYGCRGPGVRGIPFEAPVRIDMLSTAELGEEDPTLTRDGLEIFFVRYDVETEGDIWTSTRASPDAPWDPPTRVDELSTPSNDYNPALSADGLTLYLVRAEQLLVTTRTGPGADWASPAPLPGFEPGVSRACPGPSEDHLEVAYCTYGSRGDFDLFLSSRADPGADFTDGREIELLSGPGEQASPYLRVPGGLVMYFSSDRPDRELLFSTRESRRSLWGPPTLLDELNEAGTDQDPWVSDDERTIIFASDRGGSMDLYTASR